MLLMVTEGGLPGLPTIPTAKIQNPPSAAPRCGHHPRMWSPGVHLARDREISRTIALGNPELFRAAIERNSF